MGNWYIELVIVYRHCQWWKNWTVSDTRSVWVVDLLITVWQKVVISGGHIEHCVTQGHYQLWTYWTLCDTRLLSMVAILKTVWHKFSISGRPIEHCVTKVLYQWWTIEHCVTQGHYQWWTYWTVCDTRSLSVVDILNTVWHKVIIRGGHIENWYKKS